MRLTLSATEDLSLAGLSDDVLAAVLDAVQVGSQLVINDAKREIARGEKSGRTYTRRGIRHQASAPGEAPATDQGQLIASGASDAQIVQGGRAIEGYVQFSAPHAAYLEWGTRRMEARPFLTPAIDKNTETMAELVRQAMNTGAIRYQRKNT